MRRVRQWPVLAVGLLVALLHGCAVNPVTGKQDFVLMSEQEEIALGRKFSTEVLKQYRAYDNPALQSYVQSIGERLGANSHRSDLIYRFTVLDSDEVNAFAVPGGYIYITRGLMAYLNSEAELAAVLGHEIGHVTARHSVRQQSAATATGVLGAVLAAGVGIQGVDQVFGALGQAMVSGYGRDHELESDRLGAEYLARSGYPPQAMIDVVGVLKNQEMFEVQQAREEGRNPRVYHGVFASHPSNDQRLQEVVHAANRIGTNGGRVNRDDYLQRIDGLVYGDSEEDGIRRGNRFYHAGMNFALTFPVGWKVENSPEKLIAYPPDKSAVLQLSSQDLNQRIPPGEFMRVTMKLTDLRNGEDIRYGNIIGHTALTPANTPFGKRLLRVTVLYYNNRAYIFLGAAKDERNPYGYDRAFLDTAASLHPLTAAEREQAKAKHIEIIRAQPGDRFEVLARNSPITSHPVEQLRLLNGLYPNGQPAPGQYLKIVR
jgi:predicted Zn-dependent protease